MGTMLLIMMVFVAAFAIAVPIQAVLVFRIWRTSRRLWDTVSCLIPEIESLVAAWRATAGQSRSEITPIAVKITEIGDGACKLLERLTAMMEDVAARTRRVIGLHKGWKTRHPRTNGRQIRT